MLKVRFFIKLSLQFRGIEAGNQGTNISRATSSRSDKSWKKDHGVGDFWRSALCSRGMTRHDSLFVQDVMKMSSNKRRHEDVRSVYKTFTRTTGTAYTSTPLALSDGTDIRLRCQPIVKGTIRRCRRRIGCQPFLPLSLCIFFFVLSYFFLSRFLFPVFLLARRSSSFYPLSETVNKRWRGWQFFVISSFNLLRV